MASTSSLSKLKSTGGGLDQPDGQFRWLLGDSWSGCWYSQKCTPDAIPVKKLS